MTKQTKATTETKAPVNINAARAIALMKTINKESKGDINVMTLGAAAEVEGEFLSTGSVGIDIALGNGGLKAGTIAEIYGPESSGKTTLTLQLIAEAQKAGKLCAFIDAEHALDATYAQALGVDLESLIFNQPSSGEEALQLVDILAKTGEVGLIIVDSVAALTPEAELEGDMGQQHMALQARLIGQGLRKLAGPIKQNNVLLVFINQLRMKVGVMFGNPETTTGGNALKFYASYRIDIRRKASLKKKVNGVEQVVGNDTEVKVVKNKCAPPFRTARFNIMYGEGISKTSEIIQLGVQYNVISKAGSWLSYNDTQIGQGMEKAGEWLLDNPEVMQEIQDKIMEIGNPKKLK